MPVVLRFTASGFTADKYAETVKRLEAAGQGSPTGRLYHVCFGDTENLRVSDIWTSREDFEAFSQTLGPIMEDLGVVGEIEFFEVHNIIEGTRAASTAT
jgi:hypothetical protein